jgi:hypothetical protein
MFLKELPKQLNGDDALPVDNQSFLVLDVPLGLIHRIEKQNSVNSQQMYELSGILINCKVF